MSVYITGDLKIPEANSRLVQLWNDGTAFWKQDGKLVRGNWQYVSDHDPLIEREEAAHEIWLIRCEECGAPEWVCESCDNKTAMKRVMDAPVVIPAERREDGET